MNEQERYRRLFSALTIYQHNMKILHWKCSGMNFDKCHLITESYADKLGEFQDTIAEIMIGFDFNPLCLCGVMDHLNKDDHQFIALDPEKTYNAEEVFGNIKTMFDGLREIYRDVYKCDCNTTDVCSTLDEHISFLRVEGLYKNKLRLS